LVPLSTISIRKDWTILILVLTIRGDKVTTYKTFMATHKGQLFGIPPSGKRITWDVIDIIRLKDGKFVDHWNVLNWQEVMQQITQ
jgi:predicted ester cyclase